MVLNFLKSQFIEVIEWTDWSRETLVYRFPVKGNEIKMGARLTVREGQAAIFINEGRIADVFDPGSYTLDTENMPILTKLLSWKYGFNSPFKAEIYFLNTTQFTDQRWGTPNPIMLRDPEFGPMRIRAFGVYAFRVIDPGTFLREVSGTDGLFEVDEIEGQLRRHVLMDFTDALAESKVAALDMAANLEEISTVCYGRMQDKFQQYGLGLTQFIIENISLPPEVEKALDKRTQMGILGDLGRYGQFQAAEAMRAAAENPAGGAAGAGVGLGAGMVMANQMMGSMMGGGQQPQAAPAPQQAAPAAAPAQATSACSGCQASIPQGSKFCPECGAKQVAPSKTFCSECGNEVTPGAKFCSGCGTPQA